MKILTNNVADCQLLNLETGQNRRGPYVLRQDGVAPGSMHVKTHRFLLRRDGTWVNSLAVYVLPEAEGKGVGSILLAAVERAAALRGLTHLTLKATLNAEPFYSRRGWHALGHRTHKITEQIALTAVAMEKTIAPEG